MGSDDMRVIVPRPFAEVGQEATGTITIDVTCPWCSAPPGKHCHEMRNGQDQYLPGWPNTGHLARVRT